MFSNHSIKFILFNIIILSISNVQAVNCQNACDCHNNTDDFNSIKSQNLNNVSISDSQDYNVSCDNIIGYSNFSKAWINGYFNNIVNHNNHHIRVKSNYSSDDVFSINTSCKINEIFGNNHVNSILNCSIGSRSSSLSSIENYNQSSLNEKSTVNNSVNLIFHDNIETTLQNKSNIDDNNLISNDNIKILQNGIDSIIRNMLDDKNYDTTPYSQKSDKERIKDLCNNINEYCILNHKYINHNINHFTIIRIPSNLLQIIRNTIKKYEPNIVDEAMTSIINKNMQQVLDWQNKHC